MASEIVSRLPATTATVQEAQAIRNRYGAASVQSGKSVPQDGTQPPHAATQANTNDEPVEEQLVAAVSDISEFVQQVHRELQFSIDKESGRTVVRVVNADTDEVVRQIPAEEALKLARHLAEAGDTGLLLRSKA